MDAGNRAGIILVTLLVIFFALLVALMAWGAPAESVNKLRDFVGFLGDHQDQDLAKLVTSLGAGVVILLGVLVIILELSPPATPGVRITTVRSGDATIPSDEIAARVQQEVLALEHVTAARVRATGRGKRVEVEMDLHVDPQASLAQTGEAACLRTRQLLEQQMSIPLAGQPRARLHYRELRIGQGEEPAPAEAPIEERAQETARTGWERPAAAANVEPGAGDTSEDPARPS